MRALRSGEGVIDSGQCFGAPNGSFLKSRDHDPGERPALLLIDPERISRDSLVRLISERCPDIALECASSAEKVSGPGRPDVVLLDIKSAGIESPEVIRQISHLRAEMQETPIVVLSDCSADGLAETALELGLSGCIPYSLGMNVVDAAIRLVLLGGTFFPRESIRGSQIRAEVEMPEPAAPEETTPVEFPSEQVRRENYRLTGRESAVVAKLREGKPNKIIAYELGMSISTVKVHIRNIMRKVGATNRMQVALSGFPGEAGEPSQMNMNS